MHAFLIMVLAILTIFEIAEAGRYFTEKKWGWFGLSTYLAIYFLASIIHHTL